MSGKKANIASREYKLSDRRGSKESTLLSSKRSHTKIILQQKIDGSQDLPCDGTINLPIESGEMLDNVYSISKNSSSVE